MATEKEIEALHIAVEVEMTADLVIWKKADASNAVREDTWREIAMKWEEAPLALDPEQEVALEPEITEEVVVEVVAQAHPEEEITEEIKAEEDLEAAEEATAEILRTELKEILGITKLANLLNMELQELVKKILLLVITIHGTD